MVKHFLAEWLGIGSVTNNAYSFWSGFGGCIRDLAAFVVLPLVLWRKRPHIVHHHHYHQGEQ